MTRSTGFGLDGFQPLQQDIDPFDGFQLSTPPARHCRRTCPRNGKGHAIGECDGDGALIGVQDEARTHALFVAVDAASDERGGIEALTVKGVGQRGWSKGMVKGDGQRGWSKGMRRSGRGLPSSSEKSSGSSGSSAVRRRSSSWALLPETGLPETGLP